MLVRDVVRAEPRMRPSAECALPQKRAAEDSPIARAIRHAIQQRRDGGARVVDGLAGERVWGRASPAPPAPVQPYTRLSVAGKKKCRGQDPGGGRGYCSAEVRCALAATSAGARSGSCAAGGLRGRGVAAVGEEGRDASGLHRARCTLDAGGAGAAARSASGEAPRAGARVCHTLRTRGLPGRNSNDARRRAGGVDRGGGPLRTHPPRGG